MLVHLLFWALNDQLSEFEVFWESKLNEACGNHYGIKKKVNVIYLK